MDTNKVMKSVVWGISTIIGLVVAEGVYRASTSKLNKRELIGDCEVVFDEIEDEEDIRE